MNRILRFNKLFVYLIFFFTLCFVNKLSADYVWRQYSYLTADNINSAIFKDNYGWVVGDNGIIKITTDAGKTWQNQNSGITAKLNKIFNANNGFLVAVGDNKTVLISADSGVSWQNRSPITFSNISEFFDVFADTTNIWAVGNNTIILHSLDRGLTWQMQYLGFNNSRCIKFFDNNFGIVLGHRQILMTYDAGVNWLAYNIPYSFKCAFFLNNYLWFAVTDDNKLYQTYEGPLLWRHLYSFNFDVKSITFYHYFDGWIVGNNGNVYRTKNNPMNWLKVTDIPANTNYNLNVITTVNNDTLCVFGDNGYYYNRFYELQDTDYQRLYSADAGGDYFAFIGETITLTAINTKAPDKQYLRYNWYFSEKSRNINSFAKIKSNNSMQPEFSAQRSGVYYINLAVDDFRDNYKYSQARVIVSDTFLKVVNNDSQLPLKDDFVYCLKLENLNEYSFSLGDSANITLKIDISDFLDTSQYLFISKPSTNLFSNDYSNLGLWKKQYYSIIDIDVFDAVTRNLLNTSTQAFDFIKLKYKLSAFDADYKNRKFNFYNFNIANNVWTKISNDFSYNFNSENLVELTLPHLSIYGFFSQPYFENVDFEIYPNPFIPNDNNVLTGRDYISANDGTGIYFSGVALKNSELKIVNLNGFVLFETFFDNNTIVFQWNAKDKRNKYLPSGLYYVLLNGQFGKIVKKLQIIR